MKRPVLSQTLRETISFFSPRRRRWLAFLQTLRLDPHQLSEQVSAPDVRSFIICGSPRSGTTLLCAMLFQPPQMVTVMEPWDGMRLPPAALFASLRKEIETTGRLTRGKLDVNALLAEGRVRWMEEGAYTVDVTVAAAFLLGVKWPTFWQYLDLLPDTKFLVCVRDPYETINSFKQKGGRLGLGLDYDVTFNGQLNHTLQTTTADPILRRILLYEHINGAVCRHLGRDNVMVVHYERWFNDLDALWADIGAFLGVQLTNPPAVVRPSPREMDLTDQEMQLIRQYCSSASALGYSLAGQPTRTAV